MTASPYLEADATASGVGYLDVRIKSDLARAKALFPSARRALMYTPMDAVNKTFPEIESDFTSMAHEFTPCDVVTADLEAGTPDAQVFELLELCQNLSDSA